MRRNHSILLLPSFPPPKWRWWWWWWWDGELQLHQSNWVACGLQGLTSKLSCCLSGAPAVVSSPRARLPPHTKGQVQRRLAAVSRHRVPCLNLLKKETNRASSQIDHTLPCTFGSSVTATHRLTSLVGFLEHLILLHNGHLIWASSYQIRRMDGIYV